MVEGAVWLNPHKCLGGSPLYKFKFISKLLAVSTTLLVLAAPALAAKRTVATYRTSAPQDKVFSEAVSAITHEGFVLKMVDKSQGTIQADRIAWDNGNPAYSVFMTVSKDGASTSIVARFTKSPGIIGHSSNKWLNKFGKELKTVFPDLTVEAEKQ